MVAGDEIVVGADGALVAEPSMRVEVLSGPGTTMVTGLCRGTRGDILDWNGNQWWECCLVKLDVLSVYEHPALNFSFEVALHQ